MNGTKGIDIKLMAFCIEKKRKRKQQHRIDVI